MILRKQFWVLGILVTIVALIFSFKPLFKLSSKSFWNLVVTQFDKEEQERQQKIEKGDIVSGKDTILIWGNMYEIGHYSDSNHLEMHTNGLSETILKKITIHKVIKKKLYIISEEGYAVINEDNLCKVYVTVPEKEFVNGYSVDEQGNKSYYSQYIKNGHIQYLLAFNEFSEDEQKNFDKLKA